MPKLPVPVSNPQLPQQVYTAEIQGATVARANQDLARSVTGLGEALIQRQTQREVSKLNAEFAKAQAELTVEWQETLRTADPTDPEVANRFRQERRSWVDAQAPYNAARNRHIVCRLFQRG